MAVPLLQTVAPLERMPLLRRYRSIRRSMRRRTRKELKHFKTAGLASCTTACTARRFRSSSPMRDGMLPEREATSSGSPVRSIRGGMKCTSDCKPGAHRRRHYLWRSGQDCQRPVTSQFLTDSWYGRVMVERLEWILHGKRLDARVQRDQ